jgi:hypothetical protein
MTLPASHAVVKIAHFEKLILFREVNGSNADPGHCNSNAGYLLSATAAVTA